MHLPKSTYYYEISKTDVVAERNIELLDEIRTVFEQNKRRYGVRRVHQELVNRGFLYGPYCPIYGFGAIIVLLILKPFSNNMLIVFLLSMILTSILEYITSFLMEKMFDSKWWDYSKMPFNINGRVCLLNSVLFGLLGIIIIFILHPYIQNLVDLIPNEYIHYIINILIVIFCIDITATLNSLLNFKEKLQEIQNIKDSFIEKTISKSQTNILNNKINELKENIIEKNLTLSTKRFMKAFPNLKFHKLNNSFEDFKSTFEKNILTKSKKNKKDKEQKQEE